MRARRPDRGRGRAACAGQMHDHERHGRDARHQHAGREHPGTEPVEPHPRLGYLIHRDDCHRVRARMQPPACANCSRFQPSGYTAWAFSRRIIAPARSASAAGSSAASTSASGRPPPACGQQVELGRAGGVARVEQLGDRRQLERLPHHLGRPGDVRDRQREVEVDVAVDVRQPARLADERVAVQQHERRGRVALDGGLEPAGVGTGQQQVGVAEAGVHLHGQRVGGVGVERIPERKLEQRLRPQPRSARGKGRPGRLDVGRAHVEARAVGRDRLQPGEAACTRRRRPRRARAPGSRRRSPRALPRRPARSASPGARGSRQARPSAPSRSPRRRPDSRRPRAGGPCPTRAAAPPSTRRSRPRGDGRGRRPRSARSRGTRPARGWRAGT